MATPASKPPVKPESADPVVVPDSLGSDADLTSKAKSTDTTGPDNPPGVGPTITEVGDNLGYNRVTAPVKALVETTAGHLPEDAGDDDLLARAQLKAPNLTAEFVDRYQMTDQDLEDIAIGAVPPPPYNGPNFGNTDLHRTPGGWQSVPAGVDPADVGKNARHAV